MSDKTTIARGTELHNMRHGALAGYTGLGRIRPFRRLGDVSGNGAYCAPLRTRPPWPEPRRAAAAMSEVIASVSSASPNIVLYLADARPQEIRPYSSVLDCN